MRLEALRRGYAVVAVSSYNRTTGCWGNNAGSEDQQVGWVGQNLGGWVGGGRWAGSSLPVGSTHAAGQMHAGWRMKHNQQHRSWTRTAHLPTPAARLQRLPAVLKEVLQEEGLGALELFAFGASSGGGIVLRLAQRMQEVKVRQCIGQERNRSWLDRGTPGPRLRHAPAPLHTLHAPPLLQGVIAQVVPARPALLQTADGRPFPPTIFMHMAQREPGWAEQVGLALEHCQAAGIPAAEVRIAPQPVRPQLLQRSLLIGAEMAEAIVAALREGGFLDEVRAVLWVSLSVLKREGSRCAACGLAFPLAR